ncbi:type 2A phosphatase-associated protein 42, putative [Plasmodium gallinaceum]|uniref:Type 2A phosphatase-associated protein 42, putative n=1 Tax=Plasmodium gallinaceum TaxID=5849 RepID=A0A1J1GPJ9_PLAGA|nr:type 2A phosphatase-associated protein 42, putative [Plasmodium gallinaceum]CRG94433.1 type 2A phosphatase-associated protein 42, putative [Plasmodium gallinaceum]
MEINEVISLFDHFYILFDDYIVKNTKDINSYNSIFNKKEFLEFLKFYSNVKIKNKEIISNKDEIIDELIYAFKHLGKYINRCDIFSKNEEIDDINTKYLKLLLIPYILGFLSYETININIRYDRLKDSKLYFHEYINLMNIYKIIKMDDYLFDEENSTNLVNRRNIKIKRTKDEKKYQEMFEEIFKNNLKYKDGNNIDDTCDDYREMYISLIKCKFIQTLNIIDLIDTELQFLEIRNNEKEDKKENVKNSDIKDQVRKPWFFSIKKKMQLSDVTQIRNYYKDLVFKPFHNLPTISLDECAKIEMEFSLKGTNDNNQKNNENDDIQDLKNDKNDDYYKEYSKKEREKEIFDKEWDDWKDLHQKGIGNKNRNIA